MSWFHKKKAKIGSRPTSTIRRFQPTLELLEDRLAPATGFLQGTAYIDSNANGHFDNGDTLKAGALIQLYQQDSSNNFNFVTQTNADASGNYRFTGLDPATYKLVDATAGYTVIGASASSQLYAATVTPQNDIVVTLVDTAGIQIAQDSRPATAETIHFSLNSVAHYSYVYQHSITISGGGLSNPVSILSLCTDIDQNLTPPAKWNASTEPTASPGNLPFNSGRVAYLYNHYGTTALSPIDGAALQIASWELEYDANPNLTSGNFVYGVSDNDDAAILAKANFYLQDSAGKNEQAIYLRANSSITGGLQGMIATESFNFLNNIAFLNQEWPTTVYSFGSENQPVFLADETTTGAIAFGATVYDTTAPTGVQGVPQTGTVTYNLYNNLTGTGIPIATQTVTIGANGVVPNSDLFAPAPGDYSYTVTYSGDSHYHGGTSLPEAFHVTQPDLSVTKKADASAITAGQAIGFTVTITNPGSATSFGVTLNDSLPKGTGGDINWTIDTSGTGLGAGTVPADFVISGAVGSQALTLSSTFINTLGDSLAPGQSISVHIVSPTNAADGGGGGALASNQYGFNGTAIQFGSAPGGSYVWYSSHFAAQNMPTSGTVTFHVTNQQISLPSYSDPVTHSTVAAQQLSVPDADITYTDTVSVATTTFNGHWVTTVPLSYTSNAFFSGLAFQVPANGLPGGIKPVVWNGSFTVDQTFTKAPTLQWQWGAAAYKTFDSTPGAPGFQAADYNALQIKPVDSNTLSAYQNSDHSGTPEGKIGTTPIKNYVIGGGSGGGGSNWTGSNSGTIKVTPTKGGGQLVNTATVTASNVTFDSDDTATATISIALALVSADSGTVTTGTGVVGAGYALAQGTFFVYVDNSQGNITADELARIDDAIAEYDTELAPYGLTLVEVGADKANFADITINVDDTTEIGGAAQGVLGITRTNHSITLVSGWDWYVGSDANQAGSGQYDFQTIISHELGHSVGLGHSADTHSVMYASLGTGEVRRELTANDLSVLESDNGTAPEPLLAAGFVPMHVSLTQSHQTASGSTFTVTDPTAGMVAITTMGGLPGAHPTPASLYGLGFQMLVTERSSGDLRASANRPSIVNLGATPDLTLRTASAPIEHGFPVVTGLSQARANPAPPKASARAQQNSSSVDVFAGSTESIPTLPRQASDSLFTNDCPLDSSIAFADSVDEDKMLFANIAVFLAGCALTRGEREPQRTKRRTPELKPWNSETDPA